MGGLDDLLGGQALLGGHGRATEARQAGDLRHLQAGAAVQQPVAEQAGGVVIAAAALTELERGLQQRPLRGGQVRFGDVCRSEPVDKGLDFRGHGGPSVMKGDPRQGSLGRRS
jgi:hypothetical protein